MGATGRQGMLTPPRHLIQPLVYSEVGLPHSLIRISYRTSEIDDYSLFISFNLQVIFKDREYPDNRTWGS
jgi:hypothetical protein